MASGIAEKIHNRSLNTTYQNKDDKLNDSAITDKKSLLRRPKLKILYFLHKMRFLTFDSVANWIFNGKSPTNHIRRFLYSVLEIIFLLMFKVKSEAQSNRTAH